MDTSASPRDERGDVGKSGTNRICVGAFQINGFQANRLLRLRFFCVRQFRASQDALLLPVRQEQSSRPEDLPG